MNKIVLTKRTCAIFLATVLVLGTIAVSSPSFMTTTNAQAESHYDTNEYTKYAMDVANEYVDEYKSPLYSNDNNYNSYEPEYPSYTPDYKQEYPSYEKDNSYHKSNDSSSTIIKKVKCNNINSNNNEVDVNLLGIPNNDALVEAQAEDEATNANGWGYGEGNGYKQNDNGFKFVCINNNDNENNIIVINETIPEPIPPDTITCEECFEEVLTPEELANVNAILAVGFSFAIAGQSITVNSLEELCASFQGATAEQIFVALFPTNLVTPGDLINLIVCLDDVLNFDI